MNQIVLVFAIILALTASQVLGQDEFYGKQEASCIQKGGLCIKSSECEEFLAADGELCPEQAAQVFQCCYGLPKHEKRCHMHGGECFKKNSCNLALVYREASDCDVNQDCCILI